jgi:hypothetical protein
LCGNEPHTHLGADRYVRRLEQQGSYENLALDLHHEAHVEGVEYGKHDITIANQLGCAVGDAYVSGVLQNNSSPQTVAVVVDGNWPGNTVFIDVVCQ